MKPRRSSLFRMREQSMDLNQGSSLYHRKVTNTKNPIVVKEKPQILEEHPVKDKSIPTRSWIFAILFLFVTVSCTNFSWGVNRNCNICFRELLTCLFVNCLVVL